MALWAFAKDIVEGAENSPHGVIRQAIVDRLAITFRLHEAIEPKPGEVLRDRRLPQGKQLFEFGHRFLAFAKQAKN
jgi:hypothetical protein